jgi:hypothetical protein
MRILVGSITSLALLLATSFARAERKYALEDLEALVKSESWDEASQHLEDVAPSKRDRKWQVVVEKTAVARLKAFKLDREPLGGVVAADGLTRRHGFLKKNKPFMQARAEIGLKGFERCFQLHWSPARCSDRLLPFVEADAGNLDLATKAAQLQMRNAFAYFAAPLWTLVAAWGKGSKNACTAERLDESVLAAMGLPASHQMLEPGMKVAEVCLAHLKGKLQAAVLGGGYKKTNICALLKKKNAVGNAKCGGAP